MRKRIDWNNLEEWIAALTFSALIVTFGLMGTGLGYAAGFTFFFWWRRRKVRKQGLQSSKST